MRHYQIMIAGGGTAGITVAAQLIRKDKRLSIAIVEPSENHYYQPAWTLVGAGTFDYQKTIRKEKDIIPKGVHWIKDRVLSLHPDNNEVVTEKNGSYSYDILLVVPGLVNDLEAIEGLSNALGKGSVCSIYTDPQHAWKVISSFKGGNAIFTQPAAPIKCGGAPQKIMYMAEHHFRKRGIRNEVNVAFFTPGTVIFGTPEFAKTLNRIIEERKIIFKPFHKPTSIDADNKVITFEYTHKNHEVAPDDPVLNETIEGRKVEVPYEMLHLAPPQRTPDFVRNSNLVFTEGAQKGMVNVDIHSLQHMHYANVFSIGDAAGLPTAKTGAAIRKQAPVVVENIIQFLKNGNLSDLKYEGYSSCPILTGYGSMLLAEFKYGNVRDSDPWITKFVDTTKEQFSMWLLKKYGLPFLYWNFMLKGRM